MTKKQILRISIFCLLVLVLFVFLSEFFVRNSDSDRLRVRGFYMEPENSIDVGLIGASELYRGYYAPLAYREAGFTSYAMAISGAPASLYLPILKEYQRLQNPKLYVIEINGVFYQGDEKEEDAVRRKWFDNLPWSISKIQSIHENVPEELQDSYFLPIKKYHSNWRYPVSCLRVLQEELSMRQRGYSLLKGFKVTAKVKTGKNHDKKVKRHITDSGEQYLRELLQYCKDQKLENVLFVRWPHNNQYETPETYEKAEAVIREYGYDFVNFSDYLDEIGIDISTDFMDSEHLNVFGAEKMTLYFSRYITEHYDVVSEHDEEIVREWQDCASMVDRVLEVCKQETKRGTKKDFYRDSDF